MPSTSVVFGPVNKSIEVANDLAHMDPAAIWALVAMGLLTYVVYMIKQGKASDKEWQAIRKEEAIADSKMADSNQRMAEKISMIEVILAERLGK